MNPFFSIVIANYNSERYLEAAILSVLHQNCNDYELIVVDAGSTDDSLQTVLKYKDRFSWWCSEKDEGQSDAFNKGFLHACGNYFFWLNADDLLLPGTLSKAKAFLQNHPKCLWLAGNSVFIDKNSIILNCKRGPAWVKFLVKYGHVYVYGPTTIFHNTILREVGGFDKELYYTMDSDLWYKFMNKGYRFDRLHHYCWAFRIHEASKTSHTFTQKPNKALVEERQKIRLRYNRKNYKIIRLLQLLLKIISGCYIKSVIDKCKYRNQHINMLSDRVRHW
jgi:glycosyltransferase involved in cell wall biosynthesis